jgi:hypothetical protein
MNPQNDIKAFSGTLATPTSSTNGILNNDTTPTTGVIASWGATYGAATDYLNTSLGFDLGSARSVSKIELWDDNSTTRIMQSNYSVYVSIIRHIHYLLTGHLARM